MSNVLYDIGVSSVSPLGIIAIQYNISSLNTLINPVITLKLNFIDYALRHSNALFSIKAESHSELFL